MTILLGVLAAVLNSLWQAAIVAALMFLVLKLMTKINVPFNAATRYAIWWAALGRGDSRCRPRPRLMAWWRASERSRRRLAAAHPCDLRRLRLTPLLARRPARDRDAETGPRR